MKMNVLIVVLDGPHITPEESDQIRTTLQRGLRNTCSKNVVRYSKDDNVHDYKLDDIRDNASVLESTELMNVKKLDGLHLTFNLEAGSLLPLAIRLVKKFPAPNYIFCD